MSDEPGGAGGTDRRRFLKVATCALGGGIAAGLAVPAARFLYSPVGRATVTSSGAPIDVGSLGSLTVGAPPLRVPVIAPEGRDAWTKVSGVALGAAWLRRLQNDKVEALSSICPHLGCAVSWDGLAEKFVCPCHDSVFAPTGTREAGPAERGLDPLPLTVENGRILLSWVRYRQGTASREVL